jgi:hypothetical protein
VGSVMQGLMRGRSGRMIPGGLTGWVLAKLHGHDRPRPQLAVLERISLAPRQTLTLIEASGQRLLVATSADGSPVFYPMGDRSIQKRARGTKPFEIPLRRVSWLPE